VLATEELGVNTPGGVASLSRGVRADMVYVPLSNGGAVFSVGSIAWCGSLSHDGYANDVARITENVLLAFLEGKHLRGGTDANRSFASDVNR
jgi:N,N-dimethylformamidase